MKRIFALTMIIAIVSTYASFVSAEAFPNLKGEWRASKEGFVIRDEKLHYLPEKGGVTYYIDRQEGRFIAGRKVSMLVVDGRKQNETFAGVITSDLSTIYVADRDSGYSIGRIVGPDTIEFYLLADGTSPDDPNVLALVLKLKRVKK